MTNADKIRSMTDEELAGYIANERGLYCDYKNPSEEDYPKILEWLKRDVVERKRGKWITTEFKSFTYYRCSECNACYECENADFNFCPNCGADMRKGKEYT